MKNRIYYFSVTLSGRGKTEEEAWNEAIEAFAQDPGEPHTVTSEEDDYDDDNVIGAMTELLMAPVSSENDEESEEITEEEE